MQINVKISGADLDILFKERLEDIETIKFQVNSINFEKNEITLLSVK